jgi:cytochrome oxidase Cu insertion factor (SCO1/SenC/PrrC family)
MEEMNQINKNRMVLLLIAGIPVTVILVATWLWYFVANGELDLVGMLGTANRGTLVQPPRQLDERELKDANGLRFKYADLEPRWTMLVPGAGARCDEACELSLYVTRQIHVAMGKDFKRIQRMYISESSVENTELQVPELSDHRPAPPGFAQYLANEHQGLKALTLEPEDYKLLFAEHGADPSTWYLVDPQGWIMMSYNAELTYKDVIADFKFLLKNSSE